MRAICLVATLATAPLQPAFGRGSEGHAITAEIAQRRLSEAARQMVDRLLNHGTLASVASWADDVKFTTHKKTKSWHFVNIPLADDAYDKNKECKEENCIIAALDNLKSELRCGKDDDAKRDALRFVVHFVGDIHQPLHTVDEGGGFNDAAVVVNFCGLKDKGPKCHPQAEATNFHELWDGILINKTVWAWGSYVDRLEGDWLKSPEAKAVMAENTTPEQWALQAHIEARTMWNKKPTTNEIGDAYYNEMLPILDKQLGKGGLRLAAFLNEAYASNACPVK